MENQGLTADIMTPDGKKVFHETSRPVGTKTYFTSEGDDTSNHPTTMTKVGGGSDFLEITHKDGVDPITQLTYTDFNIAENKTYIHEGYIQWIGAIGDTITLEVVVKPTTTSPEASTEFKLYNGYLIVGSSFPAGTEININGKTTVGTLTDADVKLVYIPVSRDSGERPTAYWNADYNTTTHVYENIAYAPVGDGEYNMFAVEVPLERFVNKIKLKNDGFLMLQTADSSQLGQNMRIKLTTVTNTTTAIDHDWAVDTLITMHREKTV